MTQRQAIGVVMFTGMLVGCVTALVYALSGHEETREQAITACKSLSCPPPSQPRLVYIPEARDVCLCAAGER